MPATYKTPESKYAGLKIIRASRAALEEAVKWLVEELKQDVERVMCDLIHHSKPGEIPHMETGQGAASIAYQMVREGARVGGMRIASDKDTDGNHLTWWDLSHIGMDNQRPWLSNWRERHEGGFLAIYRQAFKDEMAK